MNRRYQKDSKVGSTRKSAAAAKPKRSSTSASSSSSAKRPAPGSKGARSKFHPIELPPDVKRLHNISFALLGVAVVLSAVYLWKARDWGSNSAILLGIAYACMFTSLYIDFAKVRPVQKAIRRGELPQGQAVATAGAKKPSTSEAEKKASSVKSDKTPERELPGDEGT